MAAVGKRISSRSLYRTFLALASGGRALSSAFLALKRRNEAECRVNGLRSTNRNAFHTSLAFVLLQRDTRQVTLSPAVRYLVKSNRLDPAVITPTGPKSRLLKGDVLKYLSEIKGSRVQSSPTQVPVRGSGARMPSQGHPVVPSTPSAEGKPYVDTPLSSMRKTIAKRLTLSKTTIPYSYATASCTIDNLLQLRKLLMREEEIKLTLNDFFIKAAALTLERVPQSNAVWSDDGIRLLPRVDVSVATATDDSLITPIIRGANVLRLQDISEWTRHLVAKARSGKLQPDEYQGGSFSLSNLGMYGVTEFTALINPPQSAILAVGGVQPRPSSEGVVRTVLVTLSCDARVIDYELACIWLETFRTIVESPVANLL